MHSVGISIGSVDGIDRTHLRRLRAFIDAIDPVLLSGHLAWSTNQGTYLNDLFPVGRAATEGLEMRKKVRVHMGTVEDTPWREGIRLG